MQRSIVTIAIAVGLACAANAAVAAQPKLQRQTINLTNGYAVTALIAHSPAELALAQLQAKRQEGRRHAGVGPQTIYTMAVAVDELEGIAAITPHAAGGAQTPAPGANVADLRKP